MGRREAESQRSKSQLRAKLLINNKVLYVKLPTAGSTQRRDNIRADSTEATDVINQAWIRHRNADKFCQNMICYQACWEAILQISIPYLHGYEPRSNMNLSQCTITHYADLTRLILFQRSQIAETLNQAHNEHTMPFLNEKESQC